MAKTLELHGDRLRLEDVELVAGEDAPAVRLAEEARPRVEAARAFVERVVAAIQSDLEDGTWDRRHGHLRELREYDAGLRLLVNTPARA